MPDNIPPRINWAAELLDVKPKQQILEIGCGYGAAVFAVAEKLITGRIVAIDSSPKMIAAARERNREYISTGKCEILHLDWLSAPSLGRKFDTIFVYNMNVLWMDPKEELAAVSAMLKKNGKFFIFHQPPPGNDPREYAAEFQKNLVANSFQIEKIEFNDDETVRSVCVVAKPIRR